MAQTDTDLSLSGRKKRPMPCNECRFHRRKCVHKDNNLSCERCIRLKRECVNPIRKIEYVEESPIDEDVTILEPANHMVVSYREQVQELQDQILTLEKALMEAKICQSLTYSIYDSDSTSSESGTTALSYPSPLSSESDTDFNDGQLVSSQNKQKTVDNSDFTAFWTLSMKKNGLTLNTKVKNIDDLLRFGIQALQYLDGATLYTEPRADLQSLSLMTTSRSNNIHYIFREALKKNSGHFGIVAPTVSTILLFDPDTVILNLVETFFTCYNNFHPLICRSLFYTRYETTKEIVASPLTIAMCAVMTMRPCKHIPYQPQELRQMGDQFYTLARELLSDIIDEPLQVLEASVGFLLLSHYCFQTLRFSAARHYSATAYLVSHNAVGHITEIDETDIEQVIMKRNHFYLCLQEVGLKHFMDGSHDLLDLTLFNTKLTTLPEDSDIAKTFLNIGNRLIKLFRSKPMMDVMQQLHQAQIGEATKVSLDAFFRLHQLIHVWWEEMPIEDRVFQEPFEPEKEEGGYSKIKHTYQSLPLILFHSFQISVHSCFIPNESTYDEEQKRSIYSEHANAIYHKAMLVCLKSCKAIIAISQRILEIDDVCRFEGDFLLGALETLAILTSCTDKHIAQEAGTYIKTCFSILRKTFFQDMVSVSDTLVIGKKPVKHSITLPTYDSCPSPTVTIMWESMIRSLSELGIHVG